jgi:3D (Asp-Asp-Asp) domain-containing protein
MGKRTALWIAVIAIILSIGFKFTAAAGEPGIDSFSRFWGVKTLASELPTTADGLDGSMGSTDAVASIPVLYIAPTATNTESISVWATAYSSELSQTDNTPFITASGRLVHDGVAAANFLPMGTTFTIPTLFGDKTFTVLDRMNKKYDGMHTIDLWFPDTQKAIDFGRRAVSIIITK